MDRHQDREQSTTKRRRGFAALDAETRRRIASRGGKAAHDKGRAHEFSGEEARQAGKKGGERVSTNREHMAEIGRRGGERVSRDRGHMAKIGRRGGEIVSENRAHMAEIGRKGGEARVGHGAGHEESEHGHPQENDHANENNDPAQVNDGHQDDIIAAE